MNNLIRKKGRQRNTALAFRIIIIIFAINLIYETSGQGNMNNTKNGMEQTEDNKLTEILKKQKPGYEVSNNQRDPFFPTDYEHATNKTNNKVNIKEYLKLSLVSVSPAGNKNAIINNKLVTIGDILEINNSGIDNAVLIKEINREPPWVRIDFKDNEYILTPPE